MNDYLKASDDAIMEQAYIVARGVRPMALLGHIEADPTAMLRVSTRIERLAEPGVVPFVFDRRDGVADVGYASAPWVADTYRWAIQRAEEPHLSRIVGLLLGYSPTAIAEYESQRSRRWFADPLKSAGRELPVAEAPGPCVDGAYSPKLNARFFDIVGRISDAQKMIERGEVEGDKQEWEEVHHTLEDCGERILRLINLPYLGVPPTMTGAPEPNTGNAPEGQD